MSERDRTLPGVDETEPVVLEEVAESGPEPPEDRDKWDPDAHDDEDVLEGVELSDTEETG